MRFTFARSNSHSSERRRKKDFERDKSVENSAPPRTFVALEESKKCTYTCKRKVSTENIQISRFIPIVDIISEGCMSMKIRESEIPQRHQHLELSKVKGIV